MAWARRLMRAGGAGESGLAKLTEVHAVHSAGDTMIAVALAGTLFFSVPVGEARGRVALYLLVTMAPFAVIAPVIGPILDRFRHGRRYAVAVTLFGRALLALGIARALSSAAPLALYPAAFGVLVLSRAYGVSRSAAVPRLLPEEATLVQANARLSLAGLAAGGLAAPIAAGMTALLGPSWTLRAATAVHVFAGVLALRLPAKVDSHAGEAPLARRPIWPGVGRLIPSFQTVGPSVGGLLRTAATMRALNGFVILFLAFLIRTSHLSGLNHKTELGLVAVAAGAGGFLGTGLGARLRVITPERLATTALVVVSVAALAAARWFSLVTVLPLALLSGMGQSLGKLALDATIQRDVDDEVRTSTFARSDTLMQLSWVLGGGIGIALPSNGTLGFSLAAAGLAVAVVGTLRTLRRRRAVARRTRVHPARPG